jgi:thioredoxin reductase (NADPH)
MNHDHDLLVIGAGPAGFAAGLYGSRMGLRTVLIGEVSGGMMSEAWIVENYPGVDSIRGIDLAEKMQNHAGSMGLELIIPERVSKIDSTECGFTAITESGTHNATAVVLATGCCHRTLDVAGEEEFKGKGVSYCAVCDGVFFKGRKVAVIGGGNTAAMEALYLNETAGKVFLVHRRDDLRADAKLKSEVLEGGIDTVWSKRVKEIRGDGLVKELLLEDVSDGSETVLEVDGVFIAVGESPQSQLGKDLGIETDETGFIKVDREQKTNIEGIYAAGDVTGGVHQIGVAVGEGISAAVNAYLYITGGWYGVKKR